MKTRRFSNPKYVGDPINAIRIFNEKEVDELVVLDISRSCSGKEPDYPLIESIASECFMPVCYGGGISTVQQAARIFDLGIEKIALQTSALDDLKVVSDIAKRFGSQSVVVSVDIKYNWLGKARLYKSSTKKNLSLNWLDFVNRAVSAGAGELIINSVDRDGCLNGYDISLIGQVARSVSIPVVALGGASKIADFKAAVLGGASAVAAGSMFIFHGPHRGVLITYPTQSELEEMLDVEND